MTHPALTKLPALEATWLEHLSFHRFGKRNSPEWNFGVPRSVWGTGAGECLRYDLMRFSITALLSFQTRQQRFRAAKQHCCTLLNWIVSWRAARARFMELRMVHRRRWNYWVGSKPGTTTKKTLSKRRSNGPQTS